MFTIQTTNCFDKQYQLLSKRGLTIDKLDEAIKLLETTGKLSETYKPHKLKGTYANCWKAHIETNWLLVWKKNNNELLILLLTTGTHSDLF